MSDLSGAVLLLGMSAAGFIVAKHRRTRVWLSSARVMTFLRGGQSADEAEIESGALVGGVFTLVMGILFLLISLNR
jgi:hypothetical protein